ncbi:MAG TPA: hypothetical protein VFB67_01825 [Candidatus Polarisedimenticolaceae bacterium]|nr:hypothetical protein [Candidatus Polarisedimenticolaceae bacterium]
MKKDEPLKSAYDLAMERLRAKDKAEGVEERSPLSDAQKRRIAELRSEAKAKLAELEILHRKSLKEAKDAEATAKLEENYATDRGRVESRLADAIERARKG